MEILIASLSPRNADELTAYSAQNIVADIRDGGVTLKIDAQPITKGQPLCIGIKTSELLALLTAVRAHRMTPDQREGGGI